MYEFSLTNDSVVHGTNVHSYTAHGVTGLGNGYGTTNGLDGYVYAISDFGLQQVDITTWTATNLPGTVGGTYGIGTLPDGRIVYTDNTTGTIYVYDPVAATNTMIYSANSFVDGIAVAPTGEIFLAVLTASRIDVIDSSGNQINSFSVAHASDGIAFGGGGAYGNNTDGTMTRFDFAGPGYTGAVTETVIASGGAYGDLAAVGPDGKFYISQWGSSFGQITWDDNTVTNDGVIVRIGPKGFFDPGPGVPVLGITPSSLPSATGGIAYSQTLTATGGTAPYTWSVTSGALPLGLTLDPNTGVISGTPTVVGTSTFSVTATDVSNDVIGQGYSITVNPNVDLVVSALSSSISGSVLAGSTVTINDTLSNQGTTASTSTVPVRFYLSTDPVITTSDQMIGSLSTIGRLAAGASSNGTTTVTIPANLAPGTYYIGAIVNFTNSLAETNYGNNTAATSSFTVGGSVDLEESALSSPAVGGSVNAGGTVNITDTVTNLGTLNASSVPVRYYLSTDSTITTADTMLSSRSINSLPAGASNTMTTPLTIPATLTPGTYYLGAIVNFTHSVTESNYGNNTMATSFFTVVRDVDLVVSALSSSVDNGSVNRGGSFTIHDTMANQGVTKTTASSVAERFYLSTDSTITTADTMIGSRNVSSLAGGATSYGSTKVTVPSNLAPGTYYIGAYIDFTNMQAETNESNNTRVSVGTVTVN